MVHSTPSNISILFCSKPFRVLKSFVLIFMVFLINVIQIVGQNISFSEPEIQNYDRFAYKGGTQTWDIVSTSNNRITVANNEGLLIFDGHKWEKYSLPNKTILRSVAFDPLTQKIYTGGQDELGYFQADQNGKLIYTDLKLTIPETFRQLEDVWNIAYVNKALYFRSLNKIYSYDGSQWKVYATKESTKLCQVNNTIVYNDTEKGLFKIENGNSLFIEGSEILKNKTLTNIVTLKNKWFVFTEKDGIITLYNNQWQILNNTENTFLKTNRVHSACKINDSLIAVGTYLKGILIIDHTGKTVKSITKDKGLQNNTISSLHFSPNHQLWAGTYNGIDRIDLSNNFTDIYPDGSLQGTVYATTIYNNTLYCGTENGLYFKALNDKQSNDFRLVKNTEGQVWGLDIVLGDLIMSHNDGAFVIKENIAQKISKYNGSWKFLSFEERQYCIAGSYTGLYLFKKLGNVWQEVGKISGFDESCRIMVKDAQNIWISHPYRGLFKININIEKLTANIENFGEDTGLPGTLRNTVYNIDNQIIVAAETGLFKFDQTKNKFIPYKLPGNTSELKTPIKTLELFDHQLWFATEKQLGFIQFDKNFFNSQNYQTNILELDNYLVPGFEKIFPLKGNEALILTTKGLKYYKKTNDHQKKLDVYISKIVDINHQKLICDGFKNNEYPKLKTQKFSHQSNALIFDFATNTCTKDIKYRYQLNPIQKEWSTWEYKSQKEFNNLPPGNYELIIEASDIFGNVSQPYLYSFEILAPWYRSTTAKIFYLLTGLLIILYSRRRLVKKYEQIAIDLEDQKNESQALVLQLQKEKLEAEILFKNKELGLSTMHLVQKNEAITKLKSELSKFIKKISDPEIKRELKNMVSILSDDERLDDDWDSFAQNFDIVHNDFISRLKLKYPNLTPSDLKLCVYLKLNLTTKEIAPLLNISVRGVEISRYRLRKKLDLNNEVNLNDFMMGI
jgi:DNA-binding CsgD family transcriptional regulator